MKFAHIADCHLGSWRQPQLRFLNLEAFRKTIDKCIEEKVDFILIVGDLFDMAVPSIDILKATAEKLRELKEKNISCYVIPGSHDYSFSGKNIISVFNKAGLCIDLSDKEEVIQEKENTNLLLYGIAGKKGGLEQQEIIELKDYFKKLREKISVLKKEKNIYSILLLHTTILELLPQSLYNQMKKFGTLSIKDLPSGFDYYALGHIHQNNIFDIDGKTLAYTGSLFPNNFSELEKQHTANFFIIEKDDNEKDKRITKQNIKKISLNLKNIINLAINADHETPSSLKEKILKEFKKHNLKNAIVTLRITGILKEGKPSEIDFISLEEKAGQLGAYHILRNTSQLGSKEFEIKIQDIDSKNIEEIEEASIMAAIKEKIITKKDKEKLQSFMRILDLEKIEGETSAIFASRLTKETIRALMLEKLWN